MKKEEGKSANLIIPRVAWQRDVGNIGMETESKS